MKKSLLILAACVALTSVARAQSPLTVPATPTPAPQILTTTPEMRAAQFAVQSSQNVNSLFTAIQTARATGLPARGNLPAVTAAQIDAAYGPANVVKLQAAAAALSPAASPTPTPTPTP